MSKFKFFNLIDTIFICFITFVINFAIIQFLIVGLALSFVLSMVLTIAELIVLKYFSTKKINKKVLTKKFEEEVNCYQLNFQTYSQASKLSFVKKLIPLSLSPKIVGSHIEYLKENQKHVVTIENCTSVIDENYLLNILKTYLKKTNNITIVCNDVCPKAKSLAGSIKNIKIKFINKYDFYNLCKENNEKIKENIIFNKNKLKIKDIFLNLFNINHFKGFFMSGIILLFSSFIVPFKNYYFIFGIILLIFSLICKFSKINYISNKNEYF